MLKAVFLLTVFSFLAPLQAVDWPRFRGPNGSGVADEQALPVELGPESHVVWKTALPPGNSSPALTDSRIFLTGYSDSHVYTLSIERDSGRIAWRREIERPRQEGLHKLNSPASSTPVSDGENVYAFFGDFGLVSYGPDGNERWRLKLGPFNNLHGMASSPMLAGGRLIVVCDQDTESFLLALDKDTGKEIWRAARPEVVHGFSTPTLFEPKGGAAQIVVPGSYQLTSYSLETGKRIWWVRGLTWQVKPVAVVDEETIYATGWAPGADSGARKFFPPYEEVLALGDADGDGKLAPEEIPESMKHTGSWKAIDLDHDGFMDGRDWGFYRARWASRNVTLAIRPGEATGDLTDTHMLWDYERSVPVVSSPLLYQGLLYTIKDGGILTALDAETGEVAKQGRLRDAIDSYYSSPVAGDGKIYLISETGKASVVSAGKDWETLAVGELGEPVYATPAIADGRIYVRTAGTLYAFGE